MWQQSYHLHNVFSPTIVRVIQQVIKLWEKPYSQNKISFKVQLLIVGRMMKKKKLVLFITNKHLLPFLMMLTSTPTPQPLHLNPFNHNPWALIFVALGNMQLESSNQVSLRRLFLGRMAQNHVFPEATWAQNDSLDNKLCCSPHPSHTKLESQTFSLGQLN
jgi:hypothetical protein